MLEATVTVKKYPPGTLYPRILIAQANHICGYIFTSHMTRQKISLDIKNTQYILCLQIYEKIIK